MKDMIIFMGQSNMQGETECLSENEIVAGGEEYLFLSDELVPLKNPVGEDITKDMKAGYRIEKGMPETEWRKTHILGSAVAGHSNMVPDFVRSYISVTKKDVIAVHAAKSSTVISQWLPEGEIYSAVIKKSKAAIAKAGRENIGRIMTVWLQGESDACEKTTSEEYGKMLETLYEGLKKDIGIDAFSVIRVGSFAELAPWVTVSKEKAAENDSAIKKAQEEFCASHKDCPMLSRITDSLIFGDEKYKNPYAVGHYSALGQKLIGEDAGKNLGLFVLGKM